MVTKFLTRFNESSNNTTDRRREDKNKIIHEQYFTPMKVASYMSSMFKPSKKRIINFLDAGAGVGNLTASFINSVCNWKNKPKKINATLYEIDSSLNSELKSNLELCSELCIKNNIILEVIIKNADFIESSVNKVKAEIGFKKYDYIIMNPPYKKINTDTTHKKMLLSLGIDVPNYYAAFVALSYRLLNESAQLVCIIPRSFCNGQYFKPFRKDLIKNVRIEKFHIFESRKEIFYDDVLQETLIMHLSNNHQEQENNIEITESVTDDFSSAIKYVKRFNNVVFTTDKERKMRIIGEGKMEIVAKMHALPSELKDLNVTVSTGPVVDFRVKEFLSFNANLYSVPIIYPENFRNGIIEWPIKGKRPGYLKGNSNITKSLRPIGIYVLVKRMSSKEERKRISAAILDDEKMNVTDIAFDNKVNYYHINKEGLGNKDFAKGLTLYLNSSLVDLYFRTFSGSTQVNVSDLKALKYPCYESLEKIGSYYGSILPSQEEIDIIIDRVLYS